MSDSTLMNWHCPTCKGGPRPFRKLSDKEKAHLKSEGKSPADIHRHWRCATDGCLTLMPHLNASAYSRLPEGFDD